MALVIEIAPSWNGRVDRRGGPNACWPWIGGLMTNGYGQTRVKENGRWRGAGAHQVAYYMATGLWERKSDGRLVRHLCHNRRCCNPAHLLGGTPAENADDRQAKKAGRNLIRSSPFLLPVAGVADAMFPERPLSRLSRPLGLYELPFGGLVDDRDPRTQAHRAAAILRGEAA